MRKTLAIGIAMLLLGVGLLSAQERKAFRLIFSKAPVSDVLRTISLQTGAKIIYSVPPATTTETAQRLVTVDVVVNSAEEAIRATVSSAGLTFRRVGNIFVVAEATQMKNALAPYAVQARYALTQMTADEAAALLEKAIPTITARTAGTRVLVVAIPEDQLLARELLGEREAQLRDMELVSRVVVLKYAPSDQLAKMLVTLLPNLKVTASGAPNQPGGSLALSGTREDVDEALKAIQELDAPIVVAAPDVIYKVYDVRFASANVLQKFVEDSFADVKVFVAPESYTPPAGLFNPLTGQIRTSQGTQGGQTNTNNQNNQQQQQGGGGAAAEGGFQSTSGQLQPFQMGKAGDRSKRIVLRGAAIAVESALALLAQVDVKPVQVQVEVKVVDVSPEKLTQSGFDWSWRPITAIETPAGTGFTGSLPATGTIDLNATGLPTHAGFGAFSRIPWRFDAILSAMITKKDAKLLASPNVTVVDTDDASIFIGDTIRVQLTSNSAIGGTTSQVAEFPVGILLLIRPRVNSDGNVTMRVHPVVSAVTGLNDNLPQTSTREAETTVIVKDGETIVLGGLIREDMTRTVREVPFLADIPLLGELFRSRTTNRKRSDILVFITTRIVKDGEKPAEPGKVGRSGG